MKIRSKVAGLFCCLALSTSAFGQRANTEGEAEAVIKSLQPRQGQIVLGDGLATLNVPPGFRFLSGPDANKVLVNLWGNPRYDDPLGMLMPADVSPIAREAWAVIISFTDDGYVKDEDAGKIDYDKLLKEMQKETRDGNKERAKQGYESIELVGWAAPPRYDHAAKKLYWAKELKFGDKEDRTLNYNIRILGRRGVLVLNSVASMEQLPEIETSAPVILAAVDFNPGQRYADFNAKSGDKIASYGIGALIAGGVAAKLGLFKGLLVAALAAKKFIIIGVIAVVGLITKFYRKTTND